MKLKFYRVSLHPRRPYVPGAPMMTSRVQAELICEGKVTKKNRDSLEIGTIKIMEHDMQAGDIVAERID